MEQGKSDNNYRSSVWIIIIIVSTFVGVMTILGIVKLIEIIQ